MDPETGLAVCRFFHDTALMLLWGSCAYLAALVPRDLAVAVGQRLRLFRVSALATAVLTTLAMMPIEAAAIGNGWSDALDRTTICAVLFETSVGTALLVWCALSVLLTATLLVPARLLDVATATASGLLLASLALTGHAVMDGGGLGFAHQTNDALHVLAAGAWLGSLVPLLLILTVLDDPRLRARAGLALRRFSIAGHGAVALVVVTGAANTAMILKQWPLEWSSPYRLLLSGKIAVVLCMAGLAIVNRYVVVPRMRAHGSGGARALRLGIIAEILLGITAIGCVSLFGLLEPA